MRKRSRPHDRSPPMRAFKRPHNSTAYSLCIESSDFHLYVLVCEPKFGNYHHWALQFHNLATDDCTIFEVQGAHPSLESASYQCRRKFYELKVLQCIRIGQFTFSAAALESIGHAIRNVPVRNDIAKWTCQDYIIDILHMLEEEWWLDIDDDEYNAVKDKLRTFRGPIDVVQRAVSAYPKTPPPIAAPVEMESSSSRMDIEPKNARSVQFLLNSGTER